MLRYWVALLLLLAITVGADAAPKKKPRAGAKAAAEKVKEPAAKAAPAETKESAPETNTPVPSAASATNEMDAYRAIQARPECTVQDFVDLMLMYRGEYASLKTAEKRMERARELKMIKKQKGSDTLERGTVAYAIMEIYKPESGIFFWLTGWERYAMRDVQEAGIMPTKATAGQHLSGEQLMGTITSAQEYTDEKQNWGK